MPTKVIDLFAGPGGLGEGFSAYRLKGKQPFKIVLSIEKEESAHRTLLLRAFFRQYTHKNVPEEYYAFLRGELGKQPEDELYILPELQDAINEARLEAQKLTLGKDHPRVIYGKIRTALGKDECILIGGPPCQAYSLVGRSRNYGDKAKKYSATEDHRNFLYKEYLKIIAKFQPLIFVMENVKGILSAKVNGKLIFESILNDLQNPSKQTRVTPDLGRKNIKYKIFSFVQKEDELNLFNGDENLDPHDFIIRTENYGLPQARHRVILLGIRDDIASELDDFQRLRTSDDKPTVRQVISDLPKLRSRISKGKDSTEAWRDAISSLDNITLGQIKRSNHVPDKVYEHFINYLNKINNSPDQVGTDKGLQKKIGFNKKLTAELQDWYKDNRLGNYVTNHEARGHISGDLHRYLYHSTYAKIKGESPKSSNLPQVLWPNHKNFSSGKFADRFRVQLSNVQGTTVTSHISKDGHYFIHYDPNQCRSLTVREAARIQTFPDNYYFVGDRTQQYVQVGNAVPPYLAHQLAHIVMGIINSN
ncbi:MAG: DNA cytosine methyltransferase [Proteobacteria bacterium]|nr:DNA cytosine methyltransferase [Pseudomonadota bacterium]